MLGLFRLYLFCFVSRILKKLVRWKYIDNPPVVQWRSGDEDPFFPEPFCNLDVHVILDNIIVQEAGGKHGDNEGHPRLVHFHEIYGGAGFMGNDIRAVFYRIVADPGEYRFDSGDIVSARDGDRDLDPDMRVGERVVVHDTCRDFRIG